MLYGEGFDYLREEEAISMFINETRLSFYFLFSTSICDFDSSRLMMLWDLSDELLLLLWLGECIDAGVDLFILILSALWEVAMLSFL